MIYVTQKVVLTALAEEFFSFVARQAIGAFVPV
jgi:hypothetical protein